MPIDYSQYHPKWTLISKLIRYNRAQNECEFCGLENGSIVMRYGAGKGYKKGECRPATQMELDAIEEAVQSGRYTRTDAIKKLELTRIVLTVAHLDHDKTNNRFDNLRALCQSCHLSHDIGEHVANRKYGRHWKGEQQGKLPFG